MKKIHRFLTVYVVIITVLCGYMCYVAFYKTDVEKDKLIHQVQSTITRQEKEATTTEIKSTYRPTIKDGHLVIIDTTTKDVFEYTDVDKKDLPVSVIKMMKDKAVFESQEEVYHFLESLSS